MARVTVEDCLKNVRNRFALVHLTSKRVRQLGNGAHPLVNCDNKNIVCALREIAAEKVLPRYPTEDDGSDESLQIDVSDFAND